MEPTPAAFDVIVVGAGAAGCVVASRLSEDPARRVLLIEAGRDWPPGAEPATIRDPFPSGYGDPRFGWPGLQAAVGPDRGGGRGRFTRPYIQGRVIGGSSSIMGMIAQRGLPEDFDEWQRLGADGWGWHDVLPHFRRLEHDLDFDGPLHGRDGPVPIRRHARADWPPFCRAVADAMFARGYAYLPDLHAAFGDGVAAMPMNNLPDRRVSAAQAYLDATVRRRPNLRILGDSEVLRLRTTGRRVTGVLVRTPEGDTVFDAGQTVVCGGAVFSPALLLRSGIGDGAALRALGIAPVVDLPGVGANLLNHPAVHLAAWLPAGSVQPAAQRAWGQLMLRFSSGHPDCPPSDMYLFPVNRTSWHALGARIGAISVCVNKAFSRGSVTLRGPDPALRPAVSFELLSDPRDRARMVTGARLALELLDDARVRPHVTEVFHPSGGQANALNRPTRVNGWKSRAIDCAFSIGGAALRRRALRPHLIAPRDLARDDDALHRTVLEHAAGVHHVSGTCRMGAADDRMAVTDGRCRVHGIDGLRVADASVMPTIVRATPHLTVMMIGEKVAAMVAAGG